jgi:endonuclease YncB( thermonuclease family)
MAQAAKVYTESKMAMAKSRTVTASAARDSFGRILGNVMLDGTSLADDLLKQPFGRPYGTKTAWC